MRTMRWTLGLLLCAGCTAETGLDMRPPAEAAAAPFPLVADVRVEDQRPVAPEQLAAVDGYDGKPLKSAVVRPAVADALAASLRDALAARGELAAPGQGRYDLRVTVASLGGEQLVERQAHVDMVLALVERGSGRRAWSTRVYDEERGDDWLAQDDLAFGSPEALAGLTRRVLDRAVDRALDRSGFALALR